eukprot:TRINITY_DN34313_c0_g1_i1.p1 TRINITY_DN34313_c0_g1~~TRINITY_DN34313_c0_g1_i1.p1  ORF type:complete len:175 (+),score=22.20 TRINITY_DN34313_c0_g1_i1:490-1014(+)
MARQKSLDRAIVRDMPIAIGGDGQFSHRNNNANFMAYTIINRNAGLVVGAELIEHTQSNILQGSKSRAYMTGLAKTWEALPIGSVTTDGGEDNADIPIGQLAGMAAWAQQKVEGTTAPSSGSTTPLYPPLHQYHHVRLNPSMFLHNRVLYSVQYLKDMHKTNRGDNVSCRYVRN